MGMFGLEIGMASHETYGPVRQVPVVREPVSVGGKTIISQLVRRGYAHEMSSHRAASIFPKARLGPRLAWCRVELTARHCSATRALRTWICRLFPPADLQRPACRRGGGGAGLAWQ